MKILEQHILGKVANRDWLDQCLSGKAQAFPYRPNREGKGEIGEFVFPRIQVANDPSLSQSPSPCFLVNVPIRRLPSTECDYSKHTAFFKQVQEEAFGSTAADSIALIDERLAVVAGINQIQSLDPRLNRSFKKYIRNLPFIDGVNRSFGFFWKCQWKAVKKGLYPCNKAFFILKCLSPQEAEKVRQTHEQPKGLASGIVSQVPYQKIREAIKNSGATRDLLALMEKAAPNAPIYFALLDDDSEALRVNGKGVFSRFEELIGDKHPSIVSLGYALKAEEAPLLQMAVKIDMAVRSVMPMPYFPEPCSAFKVRLPGKDHFMRALTFLGAGSSLESRRLIESGLRSFTDGVAFSPDGGIITETPNRMKTEYNQKVKRLTPAVLKEKKSLQALRGRTLQTHAFPKQWADIFYAGLPFSCSRVTDATTPMMHIFGVYDPISRMFAHDRYSSKVFDTVMKDYAKPLTDGQKNLIDTSRTRLLQLGMKKEMVDLIEETAKKSGAAIHRILSGVITG